jgi:hypothetical protein
MVVLLTGPLIEDSRLAAKALRLAGEAVAPSTLPFALESGEAVVVPTAPLREALVEIKCRNCPPGCPFDRLRAAIGERAP